MNKLFLLLIILCILTTLTVLGTNCQQASNKKQNLTPSQLQFKLEELKKANKDPNLQNSTIRKDRKLKLGDLS